MDDFRREAVELHRTMSLQVEDETCLEMIQKALQDAAAFVTGQRDAARLHRAQAEKERDATLLQIGELVEALQHMKMCGSCGEDSWDICEGGRQAQAALDKATTTEKRKCGCPEQYSPDPSVRAACPACKGTGVVQ